VSESEVDRLLNGLTAKNVHGAVIGQLIEGDAGSIQVV
jgi:hypothetical protein